MMYVSLFLCYLGMRHVVKPARYEKYILVIAGVYKTPGSVPERVR